MIVLLGLLVGGVPSKERLGYFLEIMERARQQGVEQSNDVSFRLEGKVMHKGGSLRE